MTLREKVKQLNDKVNRLFCCSDNGHSASASTFLMQRNVSSGTNTYAHGLSKAPVAVLTYEKDNQPIIFSDITFDATNITLTSDEDVEGVKFVMFIIP